MPQKVFKRLHPHLSVEPEAIFSCLEALRPYHGMLLLYDERELLDQVKFLESFHVFVFLNLVDLLKLRKSLAVCYRLKT